MSLNVERLFVGGRRYCFNALPSLTSTRCCRWCCCCCCCRWKSEPKKERSVYKKMLFLVKNGIRFYMHLILVFSRIFLRPLKQLLSLSLSLRFFNLTHSLFHSSFAASAKMPNGKPRKIVAISPCTWSRQLTYSSSFRFDRINFQCIHEYIGIVWRPFAESNITQIDGEAYGTHKKSG